MCNMQNTPTACKLEGGAYSTLKVESLNDKVFKTHLKWCMLARNPAHVYVPISPHLGLTNDNGGAEMIKIGLQSAEAHNVLKDVLRSRYGLVCKWEHERMTVAQP